MRVPSVADTRFALFGRHIIHDQLIFALAEHGFPRPVAILSPYESYERDRRLLGPYGLYSDVEAHVEQGLVTKAEFKTVNSPDCMALLEAHQCNAGFSIACRSIFKRPIIERFDGLLLNLHDSYLPDERGGALNSWRILNGVDSVGNTIHLIDEGIDTGPILYRERRRVEGDQPRPVAYDRAQIENGRILIRSFVADYCAGALPDPVPQDGDKSLYFPRLYTEENAAIDFALTPLMLERFVRAFSDPYPGAWAFRGEEKLYIPSLTVIAENTLHSFCDGRVLTVCSDGSVNVGAGRGIVNIPEISVQSGRVRADAVLNVMDILHCPSDVLEHARRTIPRVAAMK